MGGKTSVKLCALAMLMVIIFTVSASADVLFSDDFESGTLSKWTIGGRQEHNHGGQSIAENIISGGSHVGHLYQSDFSEITIEKNFNYNSNLTFAFDMKVTATSNAGPTDDDFAMGGVVFSFIDSSGQQLGALGAVKYVNSTSTSPFTTHYNPDPNVKFIALTDPDVMHTYNLNVLDVLSNININNNAIATVNFYFIAYNSGWGSGAPGLSADTLVDNVFVTPEPATIMLLGLGGLAMRRRK